MFKRSTSWDKAYAQNVVEWRGTQWGVPDFPKGARVLEVGCGSGKTLYALANKGLDVYAIDFSEPAVKLCAKIPGCKASVQDIRKTSFQDDFFDAVICIHVLAHMPLAERKEAAMEIARILKKGGQLLFRDFSTEDFRFGKGKLVEENSFKRENGLTTHYFGLDEVKELFVGLECLKAETVKWKVSYRGQSRQRAECECLFKK